MTDLIALSKKLPNNQLEILPEVDHVQAYWDSKLVAPLIRNFVRANSMVVSSRT